MHLDLTEAIKACVNEHKAMKTASPTMRNEAQVQSAFSDFWAKIMAMGSQINWSVLLGQLWTVLQKLTQGQSVADIIAWLTTLFGQTPAPGPVVGGQPK